MPGTRASSKLKQTQLDFGGNDIVTPSTTRSTRLNNKSIPKTSPVTNPSTRTSLGIRPASSPVKPSNSGLFAGRRIRRNNTIYSDEDEDNESEVEEVIRSNKGKRKVIVLSDSEHEESIRGLHISDPMLLAEAESTGDDMPTSSPAKRRGISKVVELSSSSEDELPVKRRLRRKASLEVNEEESDSDVVVQNGKQKRRRELLNEESDESSSTPRSLKRNRARKDDDLDEIRAELDDLGSSSPLLSPVKPSKLSKQKKIIAKIRREKQRRQSGVNHILSEEDESEEDDGEYRDTYQRIYSEGNLDEYEQDDDFVVDDEEDGEDGLIGSPHALPFEYSSLASAPLSELFRHAIDWLIQNKINPGFKRHSDIYDTVWKRLNDEITGLAESKFKSSSWKRDFIVSLETRPDMTSGQVKAHELDTNCEACGRSNHPATFTMQLYGKPYDPDSLEDIEQDEDDDGEYDKRGREVPAVRQWFLGRTCYENAESAHILAHWKRSLNIEVVELLREEGALKPRAIVERAEQNVAQKGKWTRDLVDRWDEQGHIGMFWQTYKDFSDTARENKKGTFMY